MVRATFLVAGERMSARRAHRTIYSEADCSAGQLPADSSRTMVTAVVSAAEPASTVRSVIEETLIPRLLDGSVRLVVTETARDWAVGAGDARAGPEGSAYASTQHVHSGYEICWVLTGRCVLSLVTESFLLDPRVAFLITPGELHRLGPTPALDSFAVLWWSVTPRGVSLPIESFMNQRQVSGVGFVTLEPALTAAPALMARELKVGEHHADLITRSLLLQVAANIVRTLARRERVHPALWERTAKVSLHVQTVAHFVETHYGTDITLQGLARVAGVSPYYLTTLFRRHTGRSALAYLSDVRQQHAIELLRNTDLEVAAVARLVGYEDPYYFSRVFKERNGCSPRSFRRMYTAGTGGAATPVTRSTSGPAGEMRKISQKSQSSPFNLVPTRG